MKRLVASLKGTFMRYALSYLLLMAILFLGFSGYSYYYYSGVIRKEVTESSFNKLSRLCYQHERYLSAIINTAEQMSLSPYIKPFRFQDDPEKAYELLRQITPYTVTNDFVDQFFLFFREDDTLYSSSSTMRLDMFLDSLMCFEDISPESLKDLLYNCDSVKVFRSQEVKSLLLDGASSRMVTVVAPLGVNYRSAIGTLIFMIKDQTYQTLMSDAIEEKANTYILHMGDVLASANTMELPKELILSAVKDIGADKTSELSYQGKKYLLLYVPGEAQQMDYVTVLPMERVELGMRSVLGKLFLVLGALLLICLPIVFLLTRKNYRPLMELRDQLVTADKTRDALADIQAGIQQLVGQNAVLSTRLDDSKPMQKHNFVLDFMKGRYQTRQAAIQTASELGLDIDRALMAVVLGSTTDNQLRPMDIGQTPLGESGLIAGQGVELVAYDQHLYLLFADDEHALDAFARYLLESCKQSTKQVAVSISQAYADFSLVSTAYLEAVTAYDNRLVMGDTRVLRFTDVSVGNAGEVLSQARSYSDAISQALHIGNSELVEQKLTELTQFLKRTSMSLFSFRLIYNDVIDMLLGAASGDASSSLDTIRYYDVFTLSSCRSLADLDNLLRTLCRRLMSKAPDQPDEQSAIQQVAGYIGANFANPDLSMTRIAEQFGLSTAKLSMAFKELTHISPSDYLLMLRIERAKELIASTDMSIKEIATAVGYYDSSSFIRRFKQYASITPLQYRQSLKQEGDESNARR